MEDNPTLCRSCGAPVRVMRDGERHTECFYCGTPYSFHWVGGARPTHRDYIHNDFDLCDSTMMWSGGTCDSVILRW